MTVVKHKANIFRCFQVKVEVITVSLPWEGSNWEWQLPDMTKNVWDHAAARLRQLLPHVGRNSDIDLSLSLYWKGPEIRLGRETEHCSEDSSSYGGVDSEVSHFNRQDTQSDRDVTPL